MKANDEWEIASLKAAQNHLLEDYHKAKARIATLETENARLAALDKARHSKPFWWDSERKVYVCGLCEHETDAADGLDDPNAHDPDCQWARAETAKEKGNAEGQAEKGTSEHPGS